MPGKQYAGPEFYEKKLIKVIERLSAEDLNYDWGRHGGWVEFRYRGHLYRFDHSVTKDKEKGQKLQYGSDAFAQIVLALEDLARIVERGIYDLQSWIEGMRFLPPPQSIPECFRQLGFEHIPGNVSDVEDRFRYLAKEKHPDVLKDDGSAFKLIKQAAEDAKQFLKSQ